MKLMLIEDEYLLNKTIRTYLESKNFEVEGFLDGLVALENISNDYDLYIIDIDIPNITGIEILEEIRKIYLKTPIIIISATIDMKMIEDAYTKGCSDYLKKPFDIKELELKIRAFTRDVNQEIEIGDALFYDKDLKSLTCKNETILLSKNEKIFISLLAQNKGDFLTNEAIETAIWGINTPHIRQLISRLRKKIPVDFIQNNVGDGYKIK